MKLIQSVTFLLLVACCSALSIANTITAPATNVTGNYTVSWNITETASAAYFIENGTNVAGHLVNKNDSWNFANKPNGIYTYQVSKCIAGSRGSMSCSLLPISKTVNVDIAPPGTKPSAPSITLPSSQTNNTYSLNWNAVRYAERYEWSRRVNGGSWSGVSSVGETSKNFNDAAGTYDYRVRGCNVYGCGSFSSVRSIEILPSTPPATVTGLSAPSASTSGQYTVSWNPTPRTAYYQWSRRVNGSGWTSPQSLTSNSSGFDDGEGSYQYRVRACNAFGCGSYSSTVTVSVAPPSSNNTFNFDFDNTSILPIFQKSNEVAITQGHSNISGGQLGYSVDIITPPAVNGLKPNLALSYNSQSKQSGLAGLGWNLSGLSSVDRCNAIYGNEGAQAQKSNPRYSRGDRLCMNGQKLELANGTGAESDNAYWSSSAEYRTEIESFYKVTPMGSHSGGPAYFKVYGKDGKIYYFGLDNDNQQSQIYQAGNSGGSISHWLLSKVEDRYGNSYTIHYNRITNNGEFYPSFVYYEPNTAIVFTYKNRDANLDLADIPTGFDAGNPTKTTKILDYVTTYVDTSKGSPSAGTPVFRYELQHIRSSATGRYLVDSIAKCGFDAGAKACARPLQFEWTGGQFAFGSATPSVMSCSGNPINVNPGGIGDSGATIDDLDQDGYNDLIGPYYVQWGTPQGCFIETNIDVGGRAGINVINTPNGKALLTQNKIMTWNIDSSVYLTTFDNRTATQTRLAHYDTPFVPVSQQNGVMFVPQLHVADFNNDGLHDFQFNGVRQHQSPNVAVSFNTVSFNESTTDGLDPYAYIDTNGDGLKEIVKGQSKFEFSASAKKSPYLKHGDFNGDGKPDLSLGAGLSASDVMEQTCFYLSECANANIQPSNATLLPQNVALNTGTGLTNAGNIESILFADDINGDGRSDLVYRFRHNNEFQLRVKLSTTNGTHLTFKDVRLHRLKQGNVLINGLLEPEHTGNLAADTGELEDIFKHIAGDINNDGLIDSFKRLGRKNAPDLLQRVTNGLGKIEQFEFDTLNSKLHQGHAFYTPDSSISFPYIQAHRGIYVIKTHSISDGVGGLNSTHYHYFGAKTHVQGRGFAGFRKIRASNVTQSLVSESEYMQAFPFTGRIKKNTTKNTEGSLISRSMHKYKVHPNHSRFIYEYAKLTQDFGLTTTAISNDLATNVSRYNYDQLGNLINVSTEKGRGYFNSGDAWAVNNKVLESTTENEYSNNLSNYLIGFLERTETVVTQPTTGESKTSTMEYDPEPGTLDVKVTRNYVGTAIENHSTVYRMTNGTVNRTSSTAKDIDGQWTSAREMTLSNFIGGLYPTTIENSMGHVTTLEYELKFGEVKTTTDPNNLISRIEFDEFGRPEEKRDEALGNTNTPFSFYCSGGPVFCPANAVFANGVYTENSALPSHLGAPLTINFYDNLQRTVRTQTYSAGGLVKMDTRYDSAGRILRQSEPYVGSSADYWTVYDEYDALGRALEIQRPDGASTSTTFSRTNGELRSEVSNRVISPTGNSTQTKITFKNSLGQIRRVLDAHNTPSDYTYDPVGNLKSTTVNNNSATRITITYDEAGNKTHMADPDAGNINFLYNGFGELRKQTWQLGTAHEKHMTFIYDDLGRLTSREDRAADNTVKMNTWGWDIYSKGALAYRLSDNDFWEFYFTNSKSQVHQRATYIGGLGWRYTSYTYDPFGREHTKTFPDGLNIRREYHALGYVAATFNTTGGGNSLIWKTGTHLDDRGTATHTQLGNGVITEKQYDPSNGMLQHIYSGKNSAANIQHLTYQHDTNGNLISRQSQRTNNIGTAIENLYEEFTYDALNRLVKDTFWGDASSPCGNNFCYDALGNLTYKSNAGVLRYEQTGNAGVHAQTSGAYNMQYDPYGNVTNRGSDTIHYDVYNKPTSIGPVSFKYGPDHARFLQINNAFNVSTYYVGGGEYEEQKSGNATTTRSYVDGVLINQNSSTGNRQFYLLTDHLGSIETITDSAANIVDRLSFDVWGERRSESWDGGDPTMGVPLQYDTQRGYTGHEHLDNLGLIHMNGRVYDPYTSRFLSADLLIVDHQYSQSYNRYTYVRNNPLSRSDPTGYCDSDSSGECEAKKRIEYKIRWETKFYGYSPTAKRAADPNTGINAIESELYGEIASQYGVQNTLGAMKDLGLHGQFLKTITENLNSGQTFTSYRFVPEKGFGAGQFGRQQYQGTGFDGHRQLLLTAGLMWTGATAYVCRGKIGIGCGYSYAAALRMTYEGATGEDMLANIVTDAAMSSGQSAEQALATANISTVIFDMGAFLVGGLNAFKAPLWKFNNPKMVTPMPGGRLNFTQNLGLTFTGGVDAIHDIGVIAGSLE